MKLQHLFSAIAGLTLVASASTSFAFMNEGSSVDTNSAGMSSMVASLREEVAAGKTACTDILNKVNLAVAEIDTRLDAGVADEAGYLDARASLLKLRSDLPCLAEQLTQMQEGMMEQVPGDVEIISDELLSEETLGGSIVQGGELGSTGYSSGMAGGGYATSGGSFGSGGGGGGSLAGGSGIGGLASLGALGAAIAVGASDNNSNTPGVVISPSTP